MPELELATGLVLKMESGLALVLAGELALAPA
jgi:hypothetical protein